MKTNQFQLSIRITLLVLIPFLFACDPPLDEKVLIINNSSMTLELFIEKKGNFKDTTAYYYLYDYENYRRFIGDSILVVECKLSPNSELRLIDNNGLGTISINNKADGLFYLKEIVDTIYLKNVSLTKEIFDESNWELYVDKLRGGGGVSKFSFTIYDNDLQ